MDGILMALAVATMLVLALLRGKQPGPEHRLRLTPSP